MNAPVAFLLLSLPLVYLSRRSLWYPGSHGFFRFISWECILWLFLSNYTGWFDDPFSLTQLFSWSLLALSLYMVVAGVVMLRRHGGASAGRKDDRLHDFEKTTVLVDKGIYGYIRHPLYASLLYLTWGIFLKDPGGLLWAIALLSSVCLWVTAILDERECLQVFGKAYADYMHRSKRFIPFVI